MSGYPGAVAYTTRAGEVFIDGETLHTCAYAPLDPTEIWGNSPDVIGENEIEPEEEGSFAFPVYVDETTYQLRMAFSGVVDRFEVPYADAYEGLEANLAYFHARFVTPPAPPTATRTSTLVMPSGASRTADIQVLRLRRTKQVDGVMLAVLELRFPKGRYV